MNKIFVNVAENIDKPRWISEVEPFLQKVAEKLNLKNEEISVLFCDDEYIRELNKTYRNADCATDVLSFENDIIYEEDGAKWKCVGDIIVSLETLYENSDYFDENNNNELKRLLIHGVLHLNGMDHGDEHVEKNVKPVCKMLQIQEDLLETLKDEKVIK